MIQDIPLLITFINLKKTFDLIDKDILQHYGTPARIVAAIHVLYDNSKSQVYIEGQLSEPFNVTTGVLQGDVLAPFLFVIIIDYLSKRSEGNFGYLTHIGTRGTVSMVTRSRINNTDHKINDLAFLTTSNQNHYFAARIIYRYLR